MTGKANGYFDTTRGDTNKDWVRLLDQAVSPIMDARGKYIQVAYPVEFLKNSPKTAEPNSSTPTTSSSASNTS